MADNDGSFESLLATGDVSSITYSNDQELLELCGLTNDYLDVTPAWNLNQTNNPYGWHGIRSICTNLLWVYRRITNATSSGGYQNGVDFYGLYSSAYGPTVNEAKTNIYLDNRSNTTFYIRYPKETLWPDYFVGVQSGIKWDAINSRYWAIVYNIRGYLDMNELPYTHSVDLYVKCGPLLSTDPNPIDNSVFDNFGDSLISTNYKLVHTLDDFTNRTYSYVFGTNATYGDSITNRGDFDLIVVTNNYQQYITGIWPDDPIPGTTNNMARGWMLMEHIGVIKYDGTNGFRYR